jgi:signal transduction histidine kinase
MQISAKDLILLISLASLVFLIAPLFLILYVRSYNIKKKKYTEEKEHMQRIYEQELLNTRIEVQEQTMQTIASDLHDNIGQLLSLSSLILGSVNTEQPEKVKEKITAAHDLTILSIKELRELAKRIQGSQLISSGLHEAMALELDYLKKSLVYAIDFKISGEVKQSNDPDRDIIVFRLFQELLNNIIKHAHATEIGVILEYYGSVFKLKVNDNGSGFNFSEGIGKRGMGLDNIQRRVSMLGGEVSFNSSSGEGTQVTVFIPYSSSV